MILHLSCEHLFFFLLYGAQESLVQSFSVGDCLILAVRTSLKTVLATSPLYYDFDNKIESKNVSLCWITHLEVPHKVAVSCYLWRKTAQFLLNGQTYVNVTHLLLIGPDRLAIILREQHVTVVMVSFCLSLTLSVSLPTAPPPSFQFHSSTHLLLIQAITLL